MRSIYYDQDGKPITMDQWCKQFEDTKSRIIRKDHLPDGHEISTVWLGLDHSFGEGPPLIFETMVFPECQDMRRYATRQQAIKGHMLILKKYSGKHG